MTTLEEALLQDGGENRMFLCPIHGDTRPSACVNVLKGVWICYTCGAKGSIKGRRDLTTDALLKFVRQRAVETKIYPEAWLDLFDGGHHRDLHPYWTGRGFSDDAIRAHRLGYEPERNAVTYPFRDALGRVLGIVYRPLDSDGPKYLYPYGLDVSEHMYGFNYDATKTAILVEGALDAIAAWDVDYRAFAIYGSRLSKAQAVLLTKVGVQRIFCVFDQDLAGVFAYEKMREDYPQFDYERITWNSEEYGKDLAELDPSDRVNILAKAVGEIGEVKVGLTSCGSSRGTVDSSPLLDQPEIDASSPSRTTSSLGGLRIMRMKR